MRCIELGETDMRQSITMRFDQSVLKAARGKASKDNRTLTNYVETLVRRDLKINSNESELEVIAPPDIRKSTAVPIPGETAAEHKHREDVFNAVIDAGGY